MPFLQRAREALGLAQQKAPARISVTSSDDGGKEAASGFEVTAGVPDVDYLDELGFPEYIQEFKRVANDPQVAKDLRATRDPLINADWTVEPASDSPRDVQMAEFAASNLYQQESKSYGAEFWSAVPWPDRLRDILRFLQNGFAAFQKVYRVQGRFTIFDKLKYIVPDSISGAQPWEFDETDKFVGIQRTFVGADGQAHSNEAMSADEMVVYTWDQEGANILGKPLIRPAWRSFKFKDKFCTMSIVDKQRTAVGVPFFENPKDDSDENRKRGEQIVKSMRGGRLEQLAVRLDTGQDFGWKEGGKEGKGFPELIDLYNRELGKIGTSRFGDLGQGDNTGSRGVAGTQASFDMLVLGAVALAVIQKENLLIRELVDSAFPRVLVHPKLIVSNVDPFEKTRAIPEFVSAVKELRAIGDIDTENEVRKRYGFMEVDPDTVAKQRAQNPPGTLPQGGQPAPAGNPADQITPQSTDGQPPDGGPPATTGRTARLRLADAGAADDPMARAKVDLEGLRTELERFQALYLSTLSNVRADMVEAIRELIRDGLQPTEAKHVRVPFQGELRDRLLAIVKSARDFGRQQVEREVGHQLRALGRHVVRDPATRRGAIATANNRAEVTVDLDVSNLVGRLQAEAVAAFDEMAATGAGAAEIAKAVQARLEDISPRQIEDMARQSTAVAFNSGRNVAITELKSQLDPMAVRVEVDPGDPNTCEPCQDLNGQAFRIGSREYLENQAPNKCEGRNRCRGFMVVFPKAATEAV